MSDLRAALQPARPGGFRRLTFDNGLHEDYQSVFVTHPNGEWDRILIARDDGSIARLIADLINGARGPSPMSETDLRAALRTVIDAWYTEGRLRFGASLGGDSDSADALVDDLLAATPEPTLDAAWAEAEAALPEGEYLGGVRLRTLNDDGEVWEATSSVNTNEVWVQAFGPTPAAALRALAARLHERTEP